MDEAGGEVCRESALGSDTRQGGGGRPRLVGVPESCP